MATLSWIVHTRYILQEPQQLTTNLPEVAMPDQVQDTTVKTETGKADPDHNLIFEDIAAQFIAIPTEAALDYITRIDTATTGAVHNDCPLPIEATAINLATTHHIDHITHHPHTEVLQVITSEITVDHIHDHPTNLQGRTHINQVPTPADHEENHTPRKT